MENALIWCDRLEEERVKTWQARNERKRRLCLLRCSVLYCAWVMRFINVWKYSKFILHKSHQNVEGIIIHFDSFFWWCKYPFLTFFSNVIWKPKISHPIWQSMSLNLQNTNTFLTFKFELYKYHFYLFLLVCVWNWFLMI